MSVLPQSFLLSGVYSSIITFSSILLPFTPGSGQRLPKFTQQIDNLFHLEEFQLLLEPRKSQWLSDITGKQQKLLGQIIHQ